MRFKRMFQWIVLTLIPMFLYTGCNDLEPHMQDTRTVILNMDYNQKSSSRSSSSVAASDLIPYNTHLILALPYWESLTSNYKNLYSRFGQGLMSTSDKKVSLEIPLNTQMKIFAFLFRENYSESDLFSAIREVGYYGESQTFSINTQTNNLSLGITLIQVTSTDNSDTTPPTASVIATTITTSGNAVVQSTEIGTAYLVKTTVSVSDVVTNNTVPPDSQWNSIPISSANINTNLPATGLENGTYKVYAEDAAGNLSSPSSNSVTVQTISIPTPDNLSASGANNTITLTWNSVSGATSYTLYWDNVSGIDSSDTAITSITNDNYTHSNMDNGSIYYYKVAAVNSSGTGNLSSVASAILDQNIQASKTFNDHTYALTSAAMTWNDAKVKATALGGYLTTINTKAENDWLTTELFILPGTWMGANDIATENTWVWDNGTTSGDSGLTDTLCNAPSGDCNPSNAKWADNTDKWFGNNPNNYSPNQDCGRIWKTTGHWDDYFCDNDNYGIIEFD
jgi:hypothetical protein